MALAVIRLIFWLVPDNGWRRVARWKNAPPDGLELLRDTIVRGHSVRDKRLWLMHAPKLSI